MLEPSYTQIMHKLNSEGQSKLTSRYSIVIAAALISYIVFLFYYIFPKIASIREKGSNISLEVF